MAEKNKRSMDSEIGNTSANASSQPRPAQAFPESFSQPLAQQAEKLLTKYRRAITDGKDGVYQFTILTDAQLPDEEFVTVARLRKGVFKVIEKRLKDRGMKSALLTEEFVSWCLPTSIEQEGSWHLLLEDPLFAPTYLIDGLLDLESSTPDTVVPGPTATAFYIRSFTIRIGNIRKLLAHLIDDGYDMNERAFNWLARFEDKDDTAYVTLRYCGQTKNKPWDRHVSDIYSNSLSGFLGRFFRSLGKWYPDVLSSATVQIVVKASTDLALPSAHLNLREQVLIALFGDGVLNLQAGGKDVMTFTDEDQTIFLSLGSDTVALLHAHAKECSSKTTEGIAQYIKDIRKYVDSNPSTKGDKKLAFTDTVQDMLSRQAVPSVIADHGAIMVTLGSDIGQLHENHEDEFFEAGGRAADSATACYNYFSAWERGFGHTFDSGATQKLVLGHHLPFVDTFPWFAKEEQDYPAARKLLVQYLDAAKPLIVLAYGDLQTFAMTQPTSEFTYKAYRAEQRKQLDGKYVQNVLGMPKLSSYSDATSGAETVVIPCFHPGRHGHMGILADKGQQIFKLISGLGWFAMTMAIRISNDNPSIGRKLLCMKIMKEINTKVHRNDPFGAALAAAKKEYLDVQKAFQQGALMRRNAPDMSKPPKGILARKAHVSRKARTMANDEAATDGVGGFEVLIQEQTITGPKGDNMRHNLSWVEEDGENWTLGPIILPEHTLPSDDNDKRFLYFVSGGLDIRDVAGTSVGARKPIASGNTKNETLPISSIALSMSEKNDLALFIEHWQEITGSDVDAVLGTSGGTMTSTLNSTEGFFPTTFFAASRSKRSLPMTSKSLRKADYTSIMSAVRTTLPAIPGDLLWLIDRFLEEHFPNGGEVDLASGSEHRDSVYQLISIFCSKATFKQHPHIRTLRSLVNIVEQGATERLIATNALTFAFEILREPFSKKKKTLVLKVDGQRKDSSRFMATVGAEVPKDTIRSWEEPKLKYDVELLEDFTDNEQGSRKRGRDDDDDDDDDDFDKSSHKVARTDQEDDLNEDMI